MRIIEHMNLGRATHRPLKDITMKTKIDVPKLSPTPLENDSIFGIFDREELPAVQAKQKDWLDIIIEMLAAITGGMILGLAMAWYLYTN